MPTRIEPTRTLGWNIANREYPLDTNGIKPKEREFVVHEGPLRIKGDLDLDASALHVYGVVVEGDLTVTGSIWNRTEERALVLIVEGKLRAQNIVLGGARVYVHRDLVARNTLYCHSSTGILTAYGRTRAKLVIRAHRNADFYQKVSGTFIDQVLRPVALAEVFHPAVLEASGELNAAAMFTRILADAELLRA